MVRAFQRHYARVDLMTSNWFLAGAIAALLLSGCAAGNSAEPSDELRAQAADFAINNVTTSLYHEFGHLLIDQFEWPVLGREENAADTIMTMLLLDEGEAAAPIAADAVRGYLESSKRYGETLPENLDFYGEHELEVQRGLLMTCLLVGSDADTYQPLAEEVGMGDNRIEACREDARLADRSWSALQEHIAAGDGRDRARNDDDAEDDEDRPSAPLGGSIAVEYDTPDAKYQAIADLMQERRLLETVAETLAARFPLRRAATLKATLCGDDDAYYDNNRNEITLCYEYTQFYYDLIADPEHAGDGMI
jgi:hypothetical protein